MLNERLIEANRMVNRHILLNETELMEYNWEEFIKPLLKLNNVKVIPFRFQGVASELQAGSLVIAKNKTRIFYNDTMSKNRVNFTICHEASHFIFDTNFGDSPEFLASSVLGKYDGEQKENELVTDATAGVFMCPDIVIVKYMESDVSFYRMSSNLKMSQSALNYRLIQFVMVRLGYSYEHAGGLVNQFRYENNKHFINAGLSGWGSTVKEGIICEYENSL